MFSIGVVISTYNNPRWLEKTLWGYLFQTKKADEIIIADDGSGADTKQLIDSFKGKLPIKHVWHKDDGFQKSKILNKALQIATADYLIFTDQDCIPRADFVNVHYQNARRGHFISAGCFRLSLKLSEQITFDDVAHGLLFSLRWLRKKGEHIQLKMLKLQRLYCLSAILNSISTTNKTWNGCNSSGWRTDLLAVNGFDEDMHYGGQDRELGERLKNNGVRPIQLRYSAIVLHLDHARPYKTEESIEKNRAVLKGTHQLRKIKTIHGISYLDKSADKNNIKVLIISKGSTGESDFRQLPNSQPYIRRGERCYHFYFNQIIDAEPDIIVVRNKYVRRRMTFFVAPQNTILMLSEPQSVVNFPPDYCHQFGILYSCQPQIVHPNIVYGPALLPWFVGQTYRHKLTYDYLANNKLPHKCKLISVITSNKAFTRGHQERIDFVVKLKQHFGCQIDIFGRGFNTFADKWDVLKDYKYHIVIENCSTDYYWTEKLSDCFLAGCYPIYYGCKNVNDYFPSDSYSAIDIKQPSEAIAKIESIIKNDTYQHNILAIEQAREMVLGKYNMFSIIADCCDKLDVDAPRKYVQLQPSKTAFDWHNLYKYVIERNAFYMLNCLKKIFCQRSL